MSYLHRDIDMYIGLTTSIVRHSGGIGWKYRPLHRHIRKPTKRRLSDSQTLRPSITYSLIDAAYSCLRTHYASNSAFFAGLE